MMWLMIIAVLAYLAYRYTHSWYAAAAVPIVFVVIRVLMTTLTASRARRSTDTLLHRKLSEAEKAHLDSVSDHQKAMHAHKAQFDPELRKRM
jgi:cation transport ATPase